MIPAPVVGGDDLLTRSPSASAELDDHELAFAFDRRAPLGADDFLLVDAASAVAVPVVVTAGVSVSTSSASSVTSGEHALADHVTMALGSPSSLASSSSSSSSSAVASAADANVDADVDAAEHGMRPSQGASAPLMGTTRGCHSPFSKLSASAPHFPTGVLTMSSAVAAASMSINNFLSSGACTPSHVPPLALGSHQHHHQHQSARFGPSPAEKMHQQLTSSLLAARPSHTAFESSSATVHIAQPIAVAALRGGGIGKAMSSAVPLSIPCSPTLSGMRVM